MFRKLSPYAPGDKIGNLNLIRAEHRRVNGVARWWWLTICECGIEKWMVAHQLNRAISCGCARVIPIKHGKHGTPEYRAWLSIIDRCENPKHKSWTDYGGRGISICHEWRHDFMAFLNAVGKRPSRHHSIERIDNNRGYEPGNVRWATKTDQSRNRRNSTFLMVEDERVHVSELAERHGIERATLVMRLKRGWPLEKALSAVPENGRSKAHRRYA